MRRDEPTEPRDLPELYERLAAHPKKSRQSVGLALAAEWERQGREKAQVTVPRIQQVTGLSRKSVQAALADLEEEKLFRREHRNGRPAGKASRGDYFHPALAAGSADPEPGGEVAPARAGPTKKRPDRVPPPSGRELAPKPPTGREGESNSINPSIP
jgi:hypothetical protein